MVLTLFRRESLRHGAPWRQDVLQMIGCDGKRRKLHSSQITPLPLETNAVPKKPNSRQWRSAARLLEFMRMWSEAHTHRKARSPSSTSEDDVMPANVESDVREDEPARSDARVCEPAAARINGAEASASTLYAAWKQKVLPGSPAKSLEGEAKTSPKRAHRSSRERRAPEPGSSRSSIESTWL